MQIQSANVRANGLGSIPLWLILHVYLALGMVANIADLCEASNVELCCAELRHDGNGRGHDGLHVKYR